MKKILFGLLMTAFMISSVNVDAQTAPLKTKTITAADTATFLNVPSKIKSFQYTYTETSGTTAGKIIFEGTVNGVWKGIDSVTLTDVATAQTLFVPITSTTYLSYRWRCTNTSSATGAIRYSYLRRTDE